MFNTIQVIWGPFSQDKDKQRLCFYDAHRCQDQCPVGTYGAGCTKSCSCENNSKCDHKTGSCLCEPGFMGESCHVRFCPEGHFGLHCGRKCPCHLPNTRRYVSLEIWPAATRFFHRTAYG